MNETIQLLQKLEQERFYGRVELHMRSGRIELIRKEETIKITPRENTRHECNNH